MKAFAFLLTLVLVIGFAVALSVTMSSTLRADFEAWKART